MPMAGAKNKDPYAPQQPAAPAPLDFQSLMQQRFGGMYGSADVSPVWMNPSSQGPPGVPYGMPSIGFGGGMPMPMPMPPPMGEPPPNSPKAPPLPNDPTAPPMANPIPGAAPYPGSAAQGIFKQLYQAGRGAGGAAGDALMARATPYLPNKQQPMPQDPMAGMGGRQDERRLGEPDPNRTQVPPLPAAPPPIDPRRTGPEGSRNPAAPRWGGRVGQRMVDRAGQAGPMPRTRRSMPMPRSRQQGY